MAKGKYGTSMCSTEYIKKPDAIPCDCRRCRHSERTPWGSLYCTFYGKHSPAKTKCTRYWCTKSAPKKPRKKTK